MSASEAALGTDDRKNDQYGWIDSIAPDLLRASRELVDLGADVFRADREPHPASE